MTRSVAIRRQEALRLLATKRAEGALDALDRRALGPYWHNSDVARRTAHLKEDNTCSSCGQEGDGGRVKVAHLDAISAAMPPRPAAPCGEPLPEELFADGYEVPD